jgi:hypothetical protein
MSEGYTPEDFAPLGYRRVYDAGGVLSFEPEQPSTLEARIAQIIRDACPREEECLADEESCFAAHPVHPAGWTNDVLVLVYADVDMLASAIAQAFRPTVDDLTRCPTCDSPSPALHPATQSEGEVTHICSDTFHCGR